MLLLIPTYENYEIVLGNGRVAEWYRGCLENSGLMGLGVRVPPLPRGCVILQM